MDPQKLWAEKYAARFAEERQREEGRREQAFLDLPHVICGEPLRAMTPRDLLLLNGVNSPFVCPIEPKPEDVLVFFWLLHVENDKTQSWRTRRKRDKMIRRLAPQPYETLVGSCIDYVEEIFMDAGTNGGVSNSERRPLGTCFLAPLIINIALETSWSQQDILGTPLPRLFQYMKAIRARKDGKEFVDHSPSDLLTSEFLKELSCPVVAA